MALCAVAGFHSNLTAGGFGLNAEIQAMQRRKLSSKAGVSSARLRPKAMRSSQSARCVHVSAQKPAAFGTMKKVSGHRGFNWLICATGPAPEENEPAEEPDQADQEPTSLDDQEICNDDHVSTNGASNLLKEKLQSIEEFNKNKVRIYEDYITHDQLSDEEALADARDVAEALEQINEMKVVAQLEELYSKSSDAKAIIMIPDVVDCAFLVLLSMSFVLAGVAIYKGVLSEPIAQVLHFLLPTIKKVYGDFLHYASTHGRFYT